MLDVWPVCAPHARARILRRDATKARAAPGIAAVLLAEDIPGHNNVGLTRRDKPSLAADEIRFHCQVVALVVGDSIAQCRAAASLVEVDYEPLATGDWDRGCDRPGKLSHRTEDAAPRRLRRRSGKGPDRVAGEVNIGGQEHFYLETQAAWAECSEAGGIFVCSSTQHPSEIQVIVAEVLKRPRNQVVVEAPRMGGGFGGKEVQGNAAAALVALAALKTGRPVRVQWDRDVDMTVTGKRHPFFAKFEAGHDSDGRLLAARRRTRSTGAGSLDLSQPVLDRALFNLDNAYYIPACSFLRAGGEDQRTSQTAFRGFGGPQGMLVIEEIVDRVARAWGSRPRRCASATSIAAAARRTRPTSARRSAASGCGRCGALRQENRTSPRGGPPSRRGTTATPGSSAALRSRRSNSASRSRRPPSTRPGPSSSSTRTAPRR